jgi:hypothetical protein
MAVVTLAVLVTAALPAPLALVALPVLVPAAL